MLSIHAAAASTDLCLVGDGGVVELLAVADGADATAPKRFSSLAYSGGPMHLPGYRSGEPHHPGIPQSRRVCVRHILGDEHGLYGGHFNLFLGRRYLRHDDDDDQLHDHTHGHAAGRPHDGPDARSGGDTPSTPAAVMANPTVTTQTLMCPCCGSPLCDCSCCPTGYYGAYDLHAPAGTIINNVPPCDCSKWNGDFRLFYTSLCTWDSRETNTDASCVSSGSPAPPNPLWRLLAGGSCGCWDAAPLYNDVTGFFEQPTCTGDCTTATAISLLGGIIAGICAPQVSPIPSITITAVAGSFVTCSEMEMARLRAIRASRPKTVLEAKIPFDPPCQFRGPDLTGPERQALFEAGQTHVTHNRRFALCMKPGFELEGRAVCPCTIEGQPRCGVTCSGYEPRKESMPT